MRTYVVADIGVSAELQEDLNSVKATALNTHKEGSAALL